MKITAEARERAIADEQARAIERAEYAAACAARAAGYKAKAVAAAKEHGIETVPDEWESGPAANSRYLQVDERTRLVHTDTSGSGYLSADKLNAAGRWDRYCSITQPGDLVKAGLL